MEQGVEEALVDICPDWTALKLSGRRQVPRRNPL